MQELNIALGFIAAHSKLVWMSSLMQGWSWHSSCFWEILLHFATCSDTLERFSALYVHENNYRNFLSNKIIDILKQLWKHEVLSIFKNYMIKVSRGY